LFRRLSHGLRLHAPVVRGKVRGTSEGTSYENWRAMLAAPGVGGRSSRARRRRTWSPSSSRFGLVGRLFIGERRSLAAPRFVQTDCLTIVARLTGVSTLRAREAC
jgi:hypothetical protein